MHKLWLVIFMVLFLAALGCTTHNEKTLTIGAILPLTGNSAQYGQYIREGIDLAVEEVNT